MVDTLLDISHDCLAQLPDISHGKENYWHSYQISHMISWYLTRYLTWLFGRFARYLTWLVGTVTDVSIECLAQLPDISHDWLAQLSDISHDWLAQLLDISHCWLAQLPMSYLGFLLVGNTSLANKHWLDLGVPCEWIAPCLYKLKLFCADSSKTCYWFIYST